MLADLRKKKKMRDIFEKKVTKAEKEKAKSRVGFVKAGSAETPSTGKKC